MYIPTLTRCSGGILKSKYLLQYNHKSRQYFAEIVISPANRSVYDDLDSTV